MVAIVHVVGFPFPPAFGSFTQDIDELCRRDPTRNVVACPSSGSDDGEGLPYRVYYSRSSVFARPLRLSSKLRAAVPSALAGKAHPAVDAAVKACRMVDSGDPTLAVWGSPLIVASLREALPASPIAYLQRHAVAGRPAPYSDCDLTVFQSYEQVREALSVVRRLGASVAVVPTGVDTARFRPPNPNEVAQARLGLGVPPSDHVVLVPGSLSPHKGTLKVLQLAEHIQSTGASIHLLIAHSSSYGGSRFHRDIVRRLAAFECVSMLGGVPHSEMEQAFWAASTTLLPLNGAEGLSRSALEAMSAGCFVVASEVPGMPVVDGQTGRLVRLDVTPAELVEHVREADSDDGRQIRRHARSFILEHHERSDFLPNLEAAFATLTFRPPR